VNRAWIFVGMTLVGTVAGQLVLKYAVTQHGEIPRGLAGAAGFIGRTLLDPLVILSLVLAFGAALTWIAAVSRLSLSTAYPFMSLAFVGTALFSALMLGESISVLRWAGIGVVVAGLILVAKG
jgi:multidrug transporter EmrE-like cation transporter